MSLLDGNEAVELEVYKAADANIVRLSREVRGRLGGFDGKRNRAKMIEIPSATDFLTASKWWFLEDQAGSSRQAFAIFEARQLGAILAIGILFLFLRDLRATLIIATAIPLSIICTFAPMYIGGSV